MIKEELSISYCVSLGIALLRSAVICRLSDFAQQFLVTEMVPFSPLSHSSNFYGTLKSHS